MISPFWKSNPSVTAGEVRRSADFSPQQLSNLPPRQGFLQPSFPFLRCCGLKSALRPPSLRDYFFVFINLALWLETLGRRTLVLPKTLPIGSCAARRCSPVISPRADS